MAAEYTLYHHDFLVNVQSPAFAEFAEAVGAKNERCEDFGPAVGEKVSFQEGEVELTMTEYWFIELGELPMKQFFEQF